MWTIASKELNIRLPLAETKLYNPTKTVSTGYTKFFFSKLEDGVLFIEILAEVYGQVTHAFLDLLDLVLSFLRQMEA